MSLFYKLALQVLVKRTDNKSSRAHVIPKASGLKTIAKSVGRKNRASIARQVMKDRKMTDKVLQILARRTQKEMSAMCSKKKPSVLRGTEADDLLLFSWEKLEAETQAVAPTVHQILRGMVEVKRRVRTSCATKHNYRPSNVAVFGMCVAISLRHKNTHMNILQKIVSLILSGGHACFKAGTLSKAFS